MAGGEIIIQPNANLNICNETTVTAITETTLTSHDAVISQTHQCMFCHENFPLKRQMLDHIISHRDKDGFRCPICTKVRPTYITMQRHVKTHGQKKIPCPSCDARFKTRWELKSHEIQHVTNRSFPCKICGEIFSNPSRLRLHSSQHRKEYYKCQICGKNFTAQGSLKNHLKLHLDEKPFKCAYCSQKFLTVAARKKHLAGHQRVQTAQYACPDCWKKYTSTTSLAVHRMKFHINQFTCFYCKKSFEEKGEFEEHVLEHETDRPFRCGQCLSSYPNGREWRRHLREKGHGEGNIDGDDGEFWLPEPEVCIQEED